MRKRQFTDDGRVEMRWQDMNRDELAKQLPEALVVLPLGATEQHGPHLPTWTDSLIVETVAERAVRRAEPGCPRPLILAPCIVTGASDHHLPSGGTLSLSVETLLAVLLDLARSIADCGGRRLALVNGHGGNRGVCSAAAAAAATRYDLAVGYLDYWSVWAPEPDGPRWPGHAGRFETAIVQAIRPDLVTTPEHRQVEPPVQEAPGWEVHSSRLWRDIDGYTDDPAAADPSRGAAWLDAIITEMADRLTDIARCL